MARPTTHSRATIRPYTRVSFRKKTRPAADYTPNVESVQARCVADGGDPAAVRLLRTTFAGGISTNALIRRMTRDEAREYNHGAPGQMFRAFLRVDKEKRFRCRLCAVDADEGGWKQARDALRHLKRDHFGLGTRCDRWLVHILKTYSLNAYEWYLVVVGSPTRQGSSRGIVAWSRPNFSPAAGNGGTGTQATHGLCSS